MVYFFQMSERKNNKKKLL